MDLLEIVIRQQEVPRELRDVHIGEPCPVRTSVRLKCSHSLPSWLGSIGASIGSASARPS
ncbi:hypothetical protein ACQPTN_21630 [Bradyrhizobium sp. 13971]